MADYVSKLAYETGSKVDADANAKVTAVIDSYKLPSIDMGTGSSSKSGDGDTALDIAEARLNLIDKEYEAQQALARAKNLEEGKNTLYYEKERTALLNKKIALQTMIAQGGKASEILGYYKDIQDIEVALNNLEDERLADLES